MLLKVCYYGDLVYFGQEVGFFLDELFIVICEIKIISGICLVGVMYFFCMFFDNEKGKILFSLNFSILIEVKSIFE